jgi:hypothetical protein
MAPDAVDIFCLTKQATLLEVAKHTEPSLSVRVPWPNLQVLRFYEIDINKAQVAVNLT